MWRLLWWRPPFLYGSVLVNLISDPDTAVRGVAWESHGAWLVIRQAALVKANAAATPMDGEVVIHRSNIAFVQVVPQ
jgi:hypothetical protein